MSQSFPRVFDFDGKLVKTPAGACLKGPLAGGVEEQFDIARFEKEFPVLFAKKNPTQLETSKLSPSLESHDIEDMLINGLTEDADDYDGNDEPAELVDSDDEDEPETARLARSERTKLQEKQ